MAALMLASAPLAAQVGPFTPPGAREASPLPPELRDRKPRAKAQPPAPALPAPPVPERAGGELRACLDLAASDPAAAEQSARAWLEMAQGPARADAGQCLGVALARAQAWDEAATAFLAARDAAPPDAHARRARLGALAGNAALAGGDGATALAALDPAASEAKVAGDAALGGEIAIDRARALVALTRAAEAEAPLAEARAALPGNAQAWLLSATLSRRLGKLAEAQAQIERAAELLPIDPAIGLEAGVIAVLSGRDEAARKSWASVIAAAPESDAATTARGYLAQLDASPVQEGKAP
jgi:tetratricopeptide (TPR) repeat protein